MAAYIGYMSKPSGWMKVVTLVLGVISLGCIAATFDEDEIRERYFLGGIVTCFLVSLIYFILHIASYGVATNLANKAVDEVYHFIGAVLLIVGASLFLQLTVTFNQKYCDDIPNALDQNPSLCGGTYDTKVTGGAFGLLNGIFYLIIIVLRVVESDDDDSQTPRQPRNSAFRNPNLT